MTTYAFLKDHSSCSLENGLKKYEDLRQSNLGGRHSDLGKS